MSENYVSLGSKECQIVFGVTSLFLAVLRYRGLSALHIDWINAIKVAPGLVRVDYTFWGYSPELTRPAFEHSVILLDVNSMAGQQVCLDRYGVVEESLFFSEANGLKAIDKQVLASLPIVDGELGAPNPL